MPTEGVEHSSLPIALCHAEDIAQSMAALAQRYPTVPPNPALNRTLRDEAAQRRLALR